MDVNPYHPAHFDGWGNCKDLKKASYCPTTDAGYESDKDSYISGKLPADLPPMFDVKNFNDPETKECSYWYQTKLDKQPQSGLVYLHVANFYWMEFSFLDNKNSQSPLDPVDDKQRKF